MGHILLLADDAGMRSALQAALEQWGYRVEVADNPDAAARSLKPPPNV